MSPLILNRNGALPNDGWYCIDTLGERVKHRARIIQLVDEKAVSAIVARFNEEAKAIDFPGQRIDRDHLSKSENHPTESLGWAMELRNTSGLPEARIGWTMLGRPLVEGQAYKFFSTDYDPDDCEEVDIRVVEGKPYKVLRPLRLSGLALSNNPGTKGQRPISNRLGDSNTDSRADNQQRANRISDRARELRRLTRTLPLSRAYQLAEEQIRMDTL